MKYKIIYFLIIISSGCTRQEITNQDNCNILLDNKLHTFTPNCIENQNSHIVLEQLKLDTDGNISIYAFSSSPTSEDGINITFTKNKNNIAKHIASGDNQTERNDPTVFDPQDIIFIKYPSFDPYHINTNLSTTTTWCLDLHNNETPTHSLLWKDKYCQNNSNDTNAIFSSKLHTTWQGGQIPNGKYFNYKASGKLSIKILKAKEKIYNDSL